MAGNAGNNLIDRLAAMADDGKLTRDAKWTPPAASRSIVPVSRSGSWADLGDVPQEVQDDALQEFFNRNPGATASTTVRNGELIVSADPEHVRNPLAYQATANANQQRVTDALSAVRADGSLADTDRETIAGAITAIGNTSSKVDAQAIATDALDRMGSDKRDYARSLLSPLIQQIKR
jgi:hypothetical protein